MCERLRHTFLGVASRLTRFCYYYYSGVWPLRSSIKPATHEPPKWWPTLSAMSVDNDESCVAYFDFLWQRSPTESWEIPSTNTDLPSPLYVGEIATEWRCQGSNVAEDHTWHTRSSLQTVQFAGEFSQNSPTHLHDIYKAQSLAWFTEQKQN